MNIDNEYHISILRTNISKSVISSFISSICVLGAIAFTSTQAHAQGVYSSYIPLEASYADEVNEKLSISFKMSLDSDNHDIDSSSSSDESNKLPRGGHVVIGEDVEVNTLNPFSPAASTGTLDLGYMYFGGVSRYNPETRVFEPDLVTHIPNFGNGLTLNENGPGPADDTLTVRYRIKPNAKWSDGEHITGADFHFTYQTLQSLPGYEDIIPSSIQYGNHYFEYEIAKSSNPTAANTTYEGLFDIILPEHQVAGSDLENDWNETIWVSAGPFKVKSYTPGVEMVLVRNDRYTKRHPITNQKLPLLDMITIKIRPKVPVVPGVAQDVVVDDLINGDVDVIRVPMPSRFDAGAPFGETFSLSPSPAPRYTMLRANPNLTVNIEPVFATEQINFNFLEQTGQACLQDSFQGVFKNGGNRNANSLNKYLKFRKAIAHLIDEQAILDAIYPGLNLQSADSHIESFNARFSEAGLNTANGWTQYSSGDRETDINNARALLQSLEDELNQNNDTLVGKTFNFTTTSTEARLATAHLFRGNYDPMLGETPNGMLSEVLDEFGVNYENDGLFPDFLLPFLPPFIPSYLIDVEIPDVFFSWSLFICSDYDVGGFTNGVESLLSNRLTDLNTSFNPNKPNGIDLSTVYTDVTNAPPISFSGEDRNFYYWGSDLIIPTTSGNLNILWNPPLFTGEVDRSPLASTIMQQAYETFDVTKSFSLALQMEEIISEDVVMIPLYNRFVAISFSTQCVAGVKGGEYVLTQNVDRWYKPNLDAQCAAE